MLKEYNLDAEDEKIIDELDNLFGVIQNKEVLKNMVMYSKLREDNEVKFGNKASWARLSLQASRRFS